jgi:peroxiredoxin
MILEVGALASHFTLLATDGREYSVPASLQGRPAVLVFFKVSCATCDLAFPYINRLAAEYLEGWSLWAISQDAPDRSLEYQRLHDLSFPVLIDAPDYTVSRLYDPPATPTLFLIGPDGRIKHATHGFAKDDFNEISGLLAACLGVRPRTIAPPGDGRPDFKPG